MPSTDTLSLTAISVAYNSANVMPGLAHSLPAGVPLVIVDNGADDGLRVWAAQAGHSVLLPGRNLGFGNACNFGAAGCASDFLLFINPDARLEPGALDALFRAAETHPDAVAFGPVLLNDQGKPRYKRNSYLLPRWPKPPRDPGTDPVVVPVLSGAVLLVRRRAFQAVGGFDPGIFLYFEDDDLSLRLTKSAGPLMLVPQARAAHAAGTSSPPSAVLSRFKGYHWARARIFVGRKHGLQLPWLGGFWDGISHLLSPKSWTDTGHRNEALGRIAGAVSLLRG